MASGQKTATQDNVDGKKTHDQLNASRSGGLSLMLSKIFEGPHPLGDEGEGITKASDRSILGHLRGPVRLRTLTTLRWMAVIGQSLAILFVHFGLGFEVPLGICLGTIAASAWLNLFIIMRFSPQRFLSDKEAVSYIAFDIIQLSALLFFTGGLQNPFAVLILAPVTIAASVLALRPAIIVGALALSGVAILALFHMPLPWRPDEAVAIPTIYIAGVWAALSFSVVFFSVYAHRIAAEASQMRSALTATQLVLSREERLSALGGLAAAAAHELGTPLATIQLTAQEMVEELIEQDDHVTSIDHQLLREDAELLISQSRRCRDILGRLSRRGEEGDAMHDRVRLDSLLKEAAGPFMDVVEGPEILFELDLEPTLEEPPMLKRRPEIIYGLRNFIENAARFATSEILIVAQWRAAQLSVTISDDGPGFSQEVLARLGEPYVNPRQNSNRIKVQKGNITSGNTHEGMGLGFFIAKTLLEHTRAQIDFENIYENDANPKPQGAWVRAQWPVAALEVEVP